MKQGTLLLEGGKEEKRATRQRKRLDRMALAKLADDYGKLDEAIKKLEAQKKRLREKILKTVSPGEEIKGSRYKIKVEVAQRAVIDPAKAYERLGKELFLRVANVSAEKTRKITTPQEFEELVEKYVETKKVRVQPV